MKVNLKNQVGALKQAKVGFSWTTLFFGPFVPLFRGDLKWLLIILLVDAVTCGIAVFVWPFVYNKTYIKGLLEKGWLPADDMSYNTLRAKGFFIPEANQKETTAVAVAATEEIDE